MKFIINGHEYEAASLERVTGAFALDLPRQAGLGLQQLATRLTEMSRLAYTDDGGVEVLTIEEASAPAGAARVSPRAVLDSEPHLRALLAFVWVSRRLDGERSLSFADACDFPILDLELVDDENEADEVESENPTQPGSDPVAAGAA